MITPEIVEKVCRETHEWWQHRGRPGYADAMLKAAVAIEKNDTNAAVVLVEALAEGNAGLREEFFDAVRQDAEG
jgi:hypothetical protein